MSWMDDLRAQYLREQAEGYDNGAPWQDDRDSGDREADPEPEPQPPSAEITLQQIDRICSLHLQGRLTAERAVELVTVAIGRWTDPK